MKFNYYITSFVWSTICKLLNAGIGFISVPLLIKYFGIDQYGLLNMAVACNAYMQLMDLGMNTGAIKFFSELKEKKDFAKYQRIVHSNFIFYLFLGIINACIFLIMAVWCDIFFNIDATQVVILRRLLFILSVMTIFSWINTVFNQVLISYEKIGFTQQINSVIIILKLFLIICTLNLSLSIYAYYFGQTFLIVMTLFPLGYKCLKNKYIDNLKLKFYWTDFKPVLMYSIGIFVLSLLQMSATQSRPIILSMFADRATTQMAYYKILETMPIFIISIGTTLSNIILPRAAAAITNNKKMEIYKISIQGTTVSTILASLITIPVILNAEELLTLYMGRNYMFLAPLLQVWCFTVLLQIHSSPNYSILVSSGKLRNLVGITAFSCLLSIGINIYLCQIIGIASVVICYLMYVTINMIYNYAYFYASVINIKKTEILFSFFRPMSISVITGMLVYSVEASFNSSFPLYIIIIVRSLVWILLFLLCLNVFKIISIKRLFSNYVR